MLRSLLLTLLVVSSSASAGEKAPAARLKMDKTGLAWIAPFDKALAAAKERSRLLFIKPIAFGTKPNGCW
ncbi:MAG: hypothetical protein OER88_03210 [Planctomycetota bacterium]|nr:hypothetical protein [Planctomycetota bacterium]